MDRTGRCPSPCRSEGVEGRDQSDLLLGRRLAFRLFPRSGRRFRASSPGHGTQLFAVVEGTGWVSGDDSKRVPIKAGQAAFWDTGESHESGTDAGMKAIVVESASFDPAKHMREIRL